MNNQKNMSREIGVIDASFLNVGSVIGSGIFLTSGLIAGLLPYSGLLWAAWIVGGIVTIFGALCYGELGAMFPRAGGPYVYLKEAYGKAPAFLYGWTFFFLIGGAGVAAIAIGFADYIGAAFPFIESSNIVFGVSLANSRLEMTTGQIVAMMAAAGLTYFNSLGLRRSARGQTIMTIARIVILGVLIVAGFVYGLKTRAVNLAPIFPPAGSWPTWSAWGVALITALWSFDGWYAANCTAEEIRDPGRTLPRALVFGTSAVLVLYLGVNIAYSLALPISRMRGMVRVGEAAVFAMAGPSVAPFFSGAVALTIFGCLSANIFFCARVPYAMARDGLFFRVLGRLSPRTNVPVRALAAQAAVSFLLIMTGTFERLVDLVLFGLVLFFAATGAAVIVLRKKAPAAVRPYRLRRTYPLLPLVFTSINAAVFVGLAWEHPGRAAVALGLTAAGIPAYLFWNKRKPRLSEANPDVPPAQREAE
jgi:APA family basic amino acid/polyamine antiporter